MSNRGEDFNAKEVASSKAGDASERAFEEVTNNASDAAISKTFGADAQVVASTHDSLRNGNLDAVNSPEYQRVRAAAEAKVFT
jgi:hypothetical protein